MISIKRSVVVFDCDGTLISSFPLLVRCLKDTLHKYGNDELKTNEDFRPFYGPDERGMLRHILKDNGKGDKAFQDYLKEYEELHSEYVKKPIPGMGELLRFLRDRRTLRLGLVTGRSKETCDYTLEALNLARFFDDVETGSPKGVNKPDSMKKLMKKIGVDKSEVIYVGDSLDDVKSMRSINIPLISVWYDNPSPKHVADLEKVNPGMTAGSPEELKALLLKYIR